jgi:hypothetical protein
VGADTRGNSRASSRRLARQYWRRTAVRTGRASIPRDGERLQRRFFGHSRARTPAGRGSRASSSRSAIPARATVRHENAWPLAHALDAFLPESRPDESRPQRTWSFKKNNL